MNPNFKPTHIGVELGIELLAIFGSREAVPKHLWETVWLIHMRLVETERDIEYFHELLAEHRAAPPASASIAGDETGEF